ncbi:MAG: hypothetical protein KatS3mg082_2826 [Nitrospiraceae bacterium]|nr:MAG: hypothetical protein KatS3mg082_2826 [Nitrospiraceae bacterium]
MLIGGAGNDTYVIDGLGDQVIEEAASGTDTVESFVSYTLPDHVEHFGPPRAVSSARATRWTMRCREMAPPRWTAAPATTRSSMGAPMCSVTAMGLNTIVEYDPSNAPYFPGGIADAIQFAADVLPNHVRWQRSGDDLILSLAGTTDQLLIPSFYTVALNQGTYLFSSNIFLTGRPQ